LLGEAFLISAISASRRRRPSLEGGLEAAGRRGGRQPALDLGQRPPRAHRRDMAPLVGADAGQNVAHASPPPG
jgi:hypothetical protein